MRNKKQLFQMGKEEKIKFYSDLSPFYPISLFSFWITDELTFYRENSLQNKISIFF